MADRTKYDAELEFWRSELDVYRRWYRGELRELYYHPCPKDRITSYESETLNALYTWLRTDWRRYIRHLMIDEFAFAGARVLDIGCGPLGLAASFVAAEVIGVDPLAAEYAKLGYRTTLIDCYPCRAENIKGLFEDGSVDVVISVNAIDHVDDFEAVASEIQRVLAPGGIVRIEAHYHAARETEPQELGDQRVIEAFDKVPLRKISDIPSTMFYPGLHPPGERLVLWSNCDRLEKPSTWPI